MHPAAAEPGRLARRVQAGHGLAGGVKDAGRQVGVQPAEGLAGQHVQPHRDQRARRRVEQRVRPGDPDQPVAEVGPRPPDGVRLEVLAEGARGVGVPRPDLPLDGGGVEGRAVRGQLVHGGDQAGHVRRGDEVLALVEDACTGPGTAPVNRLASIAFRSRPVRSGFCSDPDSANSRAMIFLDKMNQEWS